MVLASSQRPVFHRTIDIVCRSFYLSLIPAFLEILIGSHDCTVADICSSAHRPVAYFFNSSPAMLLDCSAVPLHPNRLQHTYEWPQTAPHGHSPSLHHQEHLAASSNTIHSSHLSLLLQTLFAHQVVVVHPCNADLQVHR